MDLQGSSNIAPADWQLVTLAEMNQVQLLSLYDILSLGSQSVLVWPATAVSLPDPGLPSDSAVNHSDVLYWSHPDWHSEIPCPILLSRGAACQSPQVSLSKSLFPADVSRSTLHSPPNLGQSLVFIAFVAVQISDPVLNSFREIAQYLSKDSLARGVEAVLRQHRRDRSGDCQTPVHCVKITTSSINITRVNLNISLTNK
ncbi:hypothetical protein C8J56DRAFT_897090 [Mycena floridula]|nr:hypothetical protein C8J56DRAFT_897090 [Mycena floridula]